MNEVRDVEFVWLWLTDENLGARLSKAVEIGSAHGGFAESIFPPVVTFWFGALSHFPNTDGARSRLVEELRQNFKKGGKAFHGRTKAQVSNVGSATRFALVVTANSRSTLLSDLCDLDFGEYREYEKKG